MQMLIALHDKNSTPHTWRPQPGSLRALCGCTRTNASHIWLVTNAAMSSLLSHLWLSFSQLSALPRCVAEGTTVSTRTSLSNFKRARFPSKTCTRTDYLLLAWFFKSPVGICISFYFYFLLSYNIAIARSGKREGHQHEILGLQVYIMLSLMFTKETWRKLYNRLSEKLHSHLIGSPLWSTSL